jgi:hypothetical protein
MSAADLCQWLQDTSWGVGIRESTLLFPILEGTHTIGIALSVGILLVMDLRLAGVLMRREPVSQIFNQLMPWSLGGFLLMFLTGALLFLSQASSFGSSFCCCCWRESTRWSSN